MKLTTEQKNKIIAILDSTEFKETQYADLSEEKRKSLQMFYTPAKICIQMIEKYDCETLSGKTILDPTCGSGNLLIACLIAGADSDKLFGNEYDAVAVELCRKRLNRAAQILSVPQINYWQIHQGNALHRFALTHFNEDYEEFYFKNKTQNAKRKERLDDISCKTENVPSCPSGVTLELGVLDDNIYTSSKFKARHPEEASNYAKYVEALREKEKRRAFNREPSTEANNLPCLFNV